MPFFYLVVGCWRQLSVVDKTSISCNKKQLKFKKLLTIHSDNYIYWKVCNRRRILDDPTTVQAHAKFLNKTPRTLHMISEHMQQHFTYFTLFSSMYEHTEKGR